MNNQSIQHNTDKNKTLHMIGNAHIDPVWLWQWHEGMQEIKATFRSALDRLKEYDDFIFTASSAAFYAWIEKNDPEMFAEIQNRVAEGRWELAGGWWVEPDCNIPCGEAFVRQALYGQRYFISMFNKAIRVGYNPDSFGHNAALPQILKRSGFDYYIFMRPGPHENDSLSPVFIWEAADGSGVLTFRIPYSYTAWGNGLDDHIHRCIESMPNTMHTFMCFYGVGNHGGGPTRANIERIQYLKENPNSPQLTFSTTEQFFETVTGDCAELPIIRNELQHHASGCYAAHSGVKRWNRQAENAIISAEKWGTVAHWVAGLDYPKQELENAWKLVLFNQFHDILAGTSIESAYDDAHYTYSSAIATAERVSNAALQKLAWNVATPPIEEGTPLIIFNPHAWKSTIPVEIELGWFDSNSAGITDDTGNVILSQKVRSHTSLVNSQRISFVAELPSLGYRTYRIKPVNPEPGHHEISSMKSVTKLENRWFQLDFDPQNGYINSLYDKVHKCEVLSHPAARAIVVDDPSDTWSHGVFRFDNEVGVFSGATLALVESGPVRKTVRIDSHFNKSHLVQELSLYDAIPRIDVHVSVDWHEQHKSLKLGFPLNVADPVATYEIPYGHIIRPPDGEEEPGQSWVDLTGNHNDTLTPYGLSLLNDGKYSFSTHGSEIRLTVLRSPIYAHHTPYIPDPNVMYKYIDQGTQHFTYSLLPHSGNWKLAQTVRHAAELNQPVFTLKETHHPWGKSPATRSFLTVSPDNIIISAFKLAEDNDDLIARCVETHDMPTKATFTVFGRDKPIFVDFLPCEIKTLRIPRDGLSQVTQVNLLEL